MGYYVQAALDVPGRSWTSRAYGGSRSLSGGLGYGGIYVQKKAYKVPVETLVETK
jgi:hypothetical protein